MAKNQFIRARVAGWEKDCIRRKADAAHMTESEFVRRAAMDREVTVIEESPKFGNGIGIIDRKPTINAVKEKGVTLESNTKLVSVNKSGVRVRNLETGMNMTLDAIRY